MFILPGAVYKLAEFGFISLRNGKKKLELCNLYHLSKVNVS